MTIQTQKIANEMLRICEAVNLPKRYATDISLDVLYIINSNSDQFIWLLRDNGSSILPIQQGADPVTITYYIKGMGRDNSARTFLIDCRACTIVDIPLAKAIHIASKPPYIDISRTPSLISERVKQVLEQGCKQGLWGGFYPPKSASQYSLEGWTRYFHEHGNQPMVEFMHRATWAYRSKHIAA